MGSKNKMKFETFNILQTISAFGVVAVYRNSEGDEYRFPVICLATLQKPVADPESSFIVGQVIIPEWEFLAPAPDETTAHELTCVILARAKITSDGEWDKNKYTFAGYEHHTPPKNTESQLSQDAEIEAVRKIGRELLVPFIPGEKKG